MAKLGEVCKLNMGQSPDSSSYNDTGDGIPFFQGNADFGEVHPNIRVWCNAPTKIAHPGEILISVRAPIGAMNIADCECCIGRGLASISADEAVCTTKYLWYGISSKIEELNAKGTGSTFKAVNKKTLEETEIPIRDLMEQERIAATLDSVTALITLRKQQLKKLDELVKARFVEMFGDPVNNPMNYPKSQLGKVCDVRDGTHDSPEYYDVGYPLVTSKNVTGGKIDLSECNLISEDDYKKICERSKVDRGDIIMPMIGTVGKPVIVNIEPMFAIKNVALIKFTLDSLVTNIYIKTLLESDYFDRAVLDKIRGGTQKFIALGDIRKLEIILPDLKHQQCFSTFVECVDRQKQTVQQSLEKLELMKKALMQEYFG